MSIGIYILDPSPGEAGAVRSLGDLWRLTEAGLDRDCEPNARFVELARRVVQKFPLLDADGRPSADSVWINDPVVEAGENRQAVWNLQLLPDRYLNVVCALVELGRPLGLAFLMDPEEFGFLPDGTILPAARSSEWKALADELRRSKPVTPTQMRRVVRQLAGEWLLPDGFVPAEAPGSEFGQEAGRLPYFRREVPDGWQGVGFFVRRLPWGYTCMVKIVGRNSRIASILDQAGARPVSRKGCEYAFDLEMDPPRPGMSGFTDILVDSQADRLDFRARLESAVRRLDAMRDLPGIADVLVGQVDAFPGNRIVQGGGALSALIAGALTGHHDRGRYAQQVRENFQQLPHLLPNLEKVLAHLARQPPASA